MKILIILLVLIAIVGTSGCIEQTTTTTSTVSETTTITPATTTTVISSLEMNCINSGGTVSTAMCCKNIIEFPNTCLVGACGCSPENSHEVKTCDCGEGKCFDGNTCILSEY